MKILDVPREFQPIYKSVYPKYSSGKNIEEIFYDMFKNSKDTIETDLIYIPVFWTSYYVLHNHSNNINPLIEWLDTLDKTKKYFTTIQYDTGICVKDLQLPILVFSAGGGGLNTLSSYMPTKYNYYDKNGRHIFSGNKGNIDIPLMCKPLFPSLNIEKDIYCSFMGRYDTHFCRVTMHNTLYTNNKFNFYQSVNFEKYKDILNRSIFTLAPRGFGYTSFRLFEAIMANSIPIYIWHGEKILPFDDIINWEDFSVIINASDIKKLPDILEKINISEKQYNLKKIKDKFTFEHTFKYIKSKIV